MSVKLSVAFISLCAAGILLTGAINTALSTEAANNAVTRTETTCNNGLNKSFELGTENSELLIKELLTSTMDGVLAKVGNALQAPKATVRTILNVLNANGIGQGNSSDREYMSTAAPILMRQTLGVNLAYGVTELTVFNTYGGINGEGTYRIQFDYPDTIGRSVEEHHQLMGLQFDAPLLKILRARGSVDLPIVMGSTDKLGQVVDTGLPCNLTAPTLTDGRHHTGHCPWSGSIGGGLAAFLPAENYIKNNEVGWSPVEAKGRLLSLTAFAYTKKDPSLPFVGNPGLNLVLCGLDASIISKILIESTFIKGTRSYAMQRNPWTGSENVLIGVSHGAHSIEYDGSERRLITVPDNTTSITDNIIRNHISYSMEQNMTSQIFLNASNSTSNLVTWTYNNSQYWIRGGVVQDETAKTGSPVHLTIVLIIPRSVVMGTIDAGTALVQKEIKRDNDKTASVRENDRRLLLIIIIVVTIVMLLVSVYFSVRLIVPLTNLADQMIEVGNMNLDGITRESTGMSVFTEVSKMQQAFLKMHDSLSEYRNYLPQSMLDQINMESDGNSTVEFSKEGSDRNSLTTPTASAFTGSHATLQSPGPEQLLKEHSVKKRRVSVLITNFVGWHNRFDNDGDMVDSFSSTLQKMLKIFTTNNGTPDTFSGDRVLCSFNAIRPTATHPLSACRCISAINTNLTESCIQVTSSACLGYVTCGNFGCEGMKKFSMFGPVVTLAYALERYAKSVGARTVVNQKMVKEVGDSYSTRGLDMILFPKISNDALVVYELAGPKQAQDAEWMYQIEESNKKDPWTPWNVAFEAITAKPFPHWDVATEQLSAIVSNKLTDPDLLRDRIVKWISTRQQYQPIQILYH